MSFFKTVFATVIGFFLAFFFFFIFLLSLSIGSSNQPAPYVSKTSVLTLSVSGEVSDRIPNDPFSDLTGEQHIAGLSLQATREVLKRAATDDRIKALWLQADYVVGSWGVLSEIRKEIVQFKEISGKPIYASTNDIGMNEAAWYVASAADSIFAPPESMFEMDGFYLESYFLKGMFDKVGIEPEILRFGKYKSAVEPYLVKEFSKENEEQLQPLLNIVADDFTQTAAEISGLEQENINALMNEAPRMTIQFALDKGLIHAAFYPEQVEAKLKLRIGDYGKLNTISAEKYLQASSPVEDEAEPTDGKIAVLYLNGIIMPQISEDFGDASGISYEWFVDQIEAIEKDKNVKAVLLRIDSPGGSGSTSDLIWNRINKLKEKKPVIASIGDVAASGGYYIAMAADSIMAYPASITGSIGVFSTKFNAKKLFEDHLGVTFDQVKTHEHADWFTATKPLTSVQRETFQKFQDDFYATFIQRVAQSRNMDAAAVHAVAQGRVWTGKDAQAMGLVDALGGFEDAVRMAANKANLSNYSVVVYPKRKTFLEVLMAGDFDQMQTRVMAKYVPMNKEVAFLRFVAENSFRLNCLLPVTPELR